MKIKKDAEQNEDKPGAFFDQSLKSTNNKRDKRMVSALQFITKGAIVEKAEQLRTEINIKKRAPEKDEEAQGLYKKLSQVVQKSGVRTTTSKVKHHVECVLNSP